MEEIMSEQSRKIVFITGGTDGLGKAIAKALAPNHDVIISSANASKTEAVARELGVEFAVADVRNFDSINAAVNSVIENHSRIDCFINCAGLWIEGELETNDPEKMREVLEVNLLGVMYASKAVAPHMKQQHAGMIINVSSKSGLSHKPERSVYNASKWGVTGFTKCLADDLKQHGIVVTGLFPGKMNTKLFERAGNPKQMDNAIETEEVARLVRFLLDAPSNVVYPEIGVRHISE
jgi:NAD(P)-dependent dehydrogenase (short-subunit alcohol dehydrogenase family)